MFPGLEESLKEFTATLLVISFTALVVLGTIFTVMSKIFGKRLARNIVTFVLGLTALAILGNLAN